jgi:cardiolipin synthase
VREMRAGGVRMVPFSPLYRLHSLGYRNHRKIAVIDGAIGYAGGLNISQEHLDGGKHHKSWRDTHIRMIGDAVTALHAVFAVDWYNAVGEDTFAPPSDRSLSEGGATLPVQITVSGPDSQWHAIGQLYFAMIVAARRRVFLQSPFLILNESLTEALRAAALSGIDVRIMLGARGTGFEPPYWAMNTYIKEVAAAGVRVFLYTKGYLHAKTLSIDAEICSVGSANMDIRSCSLDYELNMLIYDRQFAERMEEQFTRDLADCVEFSLEEYLERPLLTRLRDSVARLFSPLL